MLARHVFKEFVVKDAPHHIANSSVLDDYKDAWHTIFEFPNGCRVSVVSGSNFYTDETHPYEAYLTDGDKTDWDGDPWGYLDEFDLIGLLRKIKEGE